MCPCQYISTDVTWEMAKNVTFKLEHEAVLPFFLWLSEGDQFSIRISTQYDKFWFVHSPHILCACSQTHEENGLILAVTWSGGIRPLDHTSTVATVFVTFFTLFRESIEGNTVGCIFAQCLALLKTGRPVFGFVVLCCCKREPLQITTSHTGNCVCTYMWCVCMGVLVVHLDLALPTCLFHCYHDNACYARPMPYGCYGNIPYFG